MKEEQSFSTKATAEEFKEINEEVLGEFQEKIKELECILREGIEIITTNSEKLGAQIKQISEGQRKHFKEIGEALAKAGKNLEKAAKELGDKIDRLQERA